MGGNTTMTKAMWHKNCGGKVKYQKPLQDDAGFEQAGFCLKCEAFPIVQENIIFKVGGLVYERFYDKSQNWKIISKNHIKETLE